MKLLTGRPEYPQQQPGFLETVDQNAGKGRLTDVQD